MADGSAFGPFFGGHFVRIIEHQGVIGELVHVPVIGHLGQAQDQIRHSHIGIAHQPVAQDHVSLGEGAPGFCPVGSTHGGVDVLFIQGGKAHDFPNGNYALAADPRQYDFFFHGYPSILLASMIFL